MLNKRLLSKIPVNINDKELKNCMDRIRDTAIQYLFKVQEEVIDNCKILILNVYDKLFSEEKIRYRVFLTKGEDATQDFTSSPYKWRTGSLKSILSYEWYKYSMLMDEESISILNDYLNTKEKQLEYIEYFQDKIRHEKLERTHKKIKDEIDKKMELVPPLPEDFEKWVNDIGLYNSRYIFYKYSNKKVLKGYCTHCKTDIEIERLKAKHNKQGICPNCGSHVTFKSHGRVKNPIYDCGHIAIMQKLENGEIVIRYFFVYKISKLEEQKLYYEELIRSFYDNKGNVKEYEWRRFKNTDEIRWCESRMSSGWLSWSAKYDTSNVALYENNLDEVLKNTAWQYSALKELATHKPGYKFNLPVYLYYYKYYPVLEYLVKLKLYNLVSNIIHDYYFYRYEEIVNLKGKNINEVLGLSKEKLKIAQRINAGIREISLLKKATFKLTDEQILFVANYLSIDNFIKICNYTTPYKAIKYIKSKKINEITARYFYSTNEYNYILGDWIDYINDCIKLKYDLTKESILFPKNIQEQHSKIRKLVEQQKNELYNNIISEMHEKLTKMFGWEYKGYAIIPPKSMEDFIKEGQVLDHCVATYIEKVVNGNSVILFLRKANSVNQPFFTLELDPYNHYDIVQCRGYKNSVDKEIDSIVEKFKRDKIIPLQLQQYKKAI